MGVMGPLDCGGARGRPARGAFPVLLALVRTQRPQSRRGERKMEVGVEMERLIMESTFPHPSYSWGEPTCSPWISTCLYWERGSCSDWWFVFLGGDGGGEEGQFYIGKLCLNFTLKIEDPEKIFMSRTIFHEVQYSVNFFWIAN